jgi:hypothetical protein
MKKLVIVVVLAAGMCCFGISQSQADTDTGTISVTVSMESTVAITVSPDGWTIGSVAFDEVTASPEYTATNTGNVDEDFTIKGANATSGGWLIQTGPVGDDIFMVGADLDPNDSYDILLWTTDETLKNAVSFTNGTAVFKLQYSTPSGDTYGQGVAQGFVVTVTATGP